MRRKLFIVDDHRVFCQGLEAVFAAEPDFEPHAISNPEQAIGIVATWRPDVVIMDLRLGKMSGIDLASQMSALPFPPAIVVLTAYPDMAAALEAVRAGAVGFVPKSASVEQVIGAVRAAVLGGTWLPRELLAKLAADYRDPVGAPQLIEQLTAREHQVLSMMVSGLDRNGIAEKLNQSPNTVRTHIRNVIVKLGCHSAIEAVSIGLKAGLRPSGNGSGSCLGARPDKSLLSGYYWRHRWMTAGHCRRGVDGPLLSHCRAIAGPLPGHAEPFA